MPDPIRKLRKLKGPEDFNAFEIETPISELQKYFVEDEEDDFIITPEQKQKQVEEKEEDKELEEIGLLMNLTEDLDPVEDTALLGQLEELKNLGKDTEYLAEYKKAYKRKKELEGKISHLQDKKKADKEYEESSGWSAIPKWFKSGFANFKDAVADFFVEDKESIEGGFWETIKDPFSLIQASNYAGLTEDETLELYETQEKLAELRKPIVENLNDGLVAQEEKIKSTYDSYGDRVDINGVKIPVEAIKEKFGIDLSEFAGVENSENNPKLNKILQDIQEKAKGKKFGMQDYYKFISTWFNKNSKIDLNTSEIEEQKNLLDNVLQGDLGFKEGLWSMRKDIGTAGLSSMIKNFELVKAKLDFEKNPEEADEETKDLLGTINLKQNIESQGLTEDSFGYNSGVGIGHTIVMMEQYLLPGGATSKAGVTKLMSKIPLRKLESYGYKKFTLSQIKALNRLNLVEKGFISTGKLAQTGFYSPMVLGGTAEKYLGQVQVVDINGEEKILTRASHRKQFEIEAQDRLSQIDKDTEKELEKIEYSIWELEDVGAFTKEDGNLEIVARDKVKEEIQKLKKKRFDLLEKQSTEKSKVNEQLSKIYDPSGKTGKEIIEDVGLGEAFFYNYTEFLKEGISETVGGELMLKGLSRVGKGVKRITPYEPFMKSNLARKITTPVGNAKNYLDNLIKTKSDFLNEKIGGLGAISKNGMFHTGGAKIWHGFPAEVMEEIAVQLTPSYGEDYVKQLDELKNPEFYAHVIVATGLLKGFNVGMSKATDLYREVSKRGDSEYQKDKKERKDFKEKVLETYKAIDKATTDDLLANQILMSTGGTLFNPKDYERQINLLREQGKEKEAKRLEETAFINLAHKAVSSGTVRDFKKSLRRVSSNPKLSAETRQNAVEALQLLPTLERISEELNGYLNREDIFSLEMNNIFYEKNRIALEEKRKSIEKEGQKELEIYKRQNNIDNDFTLNDFVEKSKDAEYAAFIERILKSNSPKVKELVRLVAAEDLALQANTATANAILQAKSPKVQEELKAELNAIKVAQAKATATPENAPKVKENLAKEGNLTPEVVEAINEKVIDDNTKGEVTPKTVKATKEDYEAAIPGTDMFGEVVKDDIEEVPGDISNTEKLPTVEDTENISTEKDKVADIEKRRQEELRIPTETEVKNITYNGIPLKDTKYGKLERFKEQLDVMYNNNPEYFTKEGLEIADKFVNGIINEKQINAKYDAELAALEESEPKKGRLNLRPSFKDESGLLGAPMTKNLKNPRHVKVVENVKQLFKNLDEKGLLGSFADVTATMKDYHSPTTIDRNFELIREAYEQVAKEKISDAEYNQVYNNLFPYGQSGVKKGDNTFGTIEIESEQASIEEVKEIDKSADTVEKRHNPVTKKAVLLKVQEDDHRFSRVGVKIGVLGTDNEGRADEELVAISNDVNENAKVFMDDRNFKAGEEVDFVFDIDYLLDPNADINVWDKVDELKPNKRIVKTRQFLENLFGDEYTYEEIVELLKEYRNTRVPNALFDNVEFLKQVPVGIVNKGYDDSNRAVLGGGINSYYWFNNMNIALKVNVETGEPAYDEKQVRIDLNRKQNFLWREAILKNGVFTANVSESNEDKAVNRRIEKTQEEKDQGYTNEFFSLSGEFDGDYETFNKHASVGYITESFGLLSKVDNQNKPLPLSVDGVRITKDKIDNWDNFVASVNRNVAEAQAKGNPGMKAGRSVFVHKSGVNSEGEQMYTIREVINNHKSKQAEFERVSRLINTLKGDLGYTQNGAHKVNSERAKSIRAAFKNKLGIDLTEQMFSKLRRLFATEDTKVKGKYRQDYSRYAFGISEKQLENIPDFSKFETYNDFLKALLSDDKVPTINRLQNYLNNVHINVAFTKLTKNGEDIFTPGSQPFIIFDSPILSKFKAEEVVDTAKDNKVRLEGRKEYLEKKLQETQSEEAKKSLVEDIKEVEKKIEKSEKDIQVVETQEEIIEEVESTSLIYQPEIDYLENQENRNAILGISEYDSSVREYVDQQLDLTEDDGDIKALLFKRAKEEYDKLIQELKDSKDTKTSPIDQDAIVQELVHRVMQTTFNVVRDSKVNEKDFDSASYEIDISKSVSFQTKMMLSKIRDSRRGKVGFAGNSVYLTMLEAFNALHEMLSEVDNNTLEDLKIIAEEHALRNPEENKFYQDIYDRLKEVEKTNPEIVNEILYNLYQPKVEMHMVMWSMNKDGVYVARKFNANSKDPLFIKKFKWKQNLKLSGLINTYEDIYYDIDEEMYKQATELHNKVFEQYKTADVNQVVEEDLKKLLNLYGVRLNQKIFDNLYTGEHSEVNNIEEILFSSKGLLKIVNSNLTKAINISKNPKKPMRLTFGDVEDKAKDVSFDILTKENQGRINELAHLDNFVESDLNINTVYTGGKPIYLYQQPNSILNTVKNLKKSIRQGFGLYQDLKRSPITSNSFMLNLLANNPIAQEYFNVFSMSLEAIKEMGGKTQTDKSITELSDKDEFITRMGLYASTDGKIPDGNLEQEYGITLRKGAMTFPTMSDSSQLPVLKTALINLSKQNYVDETDSLDENILTLLKEQLLISDLKRIGDYMIKVENGTNIEFYDEGAVWITGMPTLNLTTVQVNGNSRAFIHVYRTEIEKIKAEKISIAEKEIKVAAKIKELTDKYKNEIDAEVQKNIRLEADKLITVDNSKGQFKDFELIDEAGNMLMSNGKKDDFFDGKTPRHIAIDYMVNYFLQQKEIQTIFFGDMPNYFKTKMGSNLKHGLPQITEKDIEAYGDMDLMQYVTLEDDQVKQEDAEKIYNALLPVAKMKVMNMFKDVQNNLSKRLKEGISPGSQLVNSQNSPDYYQLMIKDAKNASKTLEYLIGLHHPELVKNVELMEDVREFKILDEEYNRSQEQETKHKNLKKKIEKSIPKISDYLETAVTDAQEYTTWQDNLDQLLGQGRIYKTDYIALKEKFKAQEKDLEENNGVIKEENRLTPEEHSMAMMQPSKPLYSGLHFEDVNGHLASRYVYIKSSSFPLTPELVENFPDLKTLAKKMKMLGEAMSLEGGNQNTRVRASYGTANKSGGVQNGISLGELYNESFEDVDLEAMKRSSVRLNPRNFYIQQDKPFKGDKNAAKGKKDETTLATQFEKIILGDGINKITRRVFPKTMFDKKLLDALGIKEEDEKLNGPELKLIYDELYRKMQELYTEELFDSLGINTFKDISEGKPEVMEKFAKVLNKRITNKQDKQALELLYVDVRGQHYTKQEVQNSKEDLGIVKAVFRIPLFMSPNSRKFESVMNSIVSKSNIRKKLPGYSSPVGSEQGFDQRGFGEIIGEETEAEARERDFKKLASQGLLTTPNYDPSKGLQSQRYEDGSLKYAQVFVPNRFKYFDTESKTYKTINMEDYLTNGQIDYGKFPKEVLSMFSYRIPTSAHQSGAIIEIAGFLPTNHADLMIVPKDHTVQIGEDYDIDVRYMYTYNLVKDGDAIKVMSYEDIKEKPEKSTTELAEEYRGHLNELWNEYYKLTGNVNPLKQVARLRNPDLAKISAIAFLEEQDFAENKYGSETNTMLKAIFGEDFEIEGFNTKELITAIEGQFSTNFITERRKEYNEYKKLLKEAFRNEKSELRGYWNAYHNAKNQKVTEEAVLENNLISMYKSVFQADDNEVQELITKVLSTEFSKTSANTIADKRYKPEEVYNIYSPATQREVMKLGADGKAGIGKHSTAVTFQSILQQLDEPLQFYSFVDDETKKIFRYDIKLGNLVFDGKLGKIKDAVGRRQSEYTMESQNSATDNQKVQIMGKRNENTETMGVFSLMQMTGLEVEPNSNFKVNGKDISYASLFVAQDILVEYTDLAKKFKSSTNKEFGKTEDLIEDVLKEKYLENVPIEMWAVDKAGAPRVGVFSRKAKEKIGKSLTSSNLFNQIDNENVDYAKQWFIYQTFRTFKSLASDLRDLEQFTNIENGGLGISYFNTMDLKDMLYEINVLKIAPERLENMDDTSTSTFKSLYGDMITRVRSADVPQRRKEGYVYIEETSLGEHTMVKPNNHYAHKIINSISLGYNLWNSVFPYDNPAIEQQINIILNSLNIPEGTKEELDMKYKIVSSMKDYAYANNPKLFGDDITAVQNELFFDVKGINQSLGSYIKSLEYSAKYNYLSKEPFFKDLKVEVNEKTYPTTISFNSGDITPEYNTRMNNFISKLMNSNKVLPDYNGKPMTEAELAKNLLMYSLIADQANGATGFQRLLPLQLFEKYGVAQSLRTNNNPNNTATLSFTYNGVTKAVESLLGNVADDNGFIERRDPTTLDTVVVKLNKMPKAIREYYIGEVPVEELTQEELEQTVEFLNLEELKQIAYKANQKVGRNQYIVAEEGNGIIDTESEQGINMSTFARQFIQHNLDAVKTPIYYQWAKPEATTKPPFQRLMEENNLKQVDFNNNPVNELRTVNFNDNYIVIVDKKKQRRLYEKQNSIDISGDKTLNTYKRVMPLGTNGFNEYNAGNKVDYSKVDKNRFNNNEKQDLVTNATAVINSINNTNITKILDNIKKDKNHRYNALLEVFRQFIPDEENLKISDKENLKISASFTIKQLAAYDPKTSTILINEAFIKDPTTTIQEIQRVIMEEVLHDITIQAVKPYGKFVLGNNGVVTFQAVEGVQTPAELISLTSLYNAAIQHYTKKYGDEKLSKLINKFRTDSSDNNAIEVFSEEDIAAYRLSNFDEFIAGIFIEDSGFITEMQKTPYKKSGKNILQKFSELMAKLFNRILPKAKKTSISTNVFDTLYTFLKENKEKGPQVKKEVPIQNKPNSDAFDKGQKLAAPFIRYNALGNININNNQETQYQNNTDQSDEDYIASEKTIRDLAARIADRIGLDVRFESDRTKDYKGKLERNTAVINLAHATLDTPIHEILGHPIIRAIKKGNTQSFAAWVYNNNPEFVNKYPFIGAERIVNEKLSEKEKSELLSQFKKDTTGNKSLYQNLLKELEYGKGKEVLDRIKRDYQYKDVNKYGQTIKLKNGNIVNVIDNNHFDIFTENDDLVESRLTKNKLLETYPEVEDKLLKENYTLEEQQEEAIVELVSLMAAGKIQETKDTKNLLSLLKQLWIEMSNFVKNLLSKKEVDISKDLDNIQQLSENKLIEFMKKGLIKEDCK